MKCSKKRWLTMAATATIYLVALAVRADEQLFGFVRGAETLPQGQSELYQFVTLRTGKNEGTYYGVDFETEVEHGFTDRLQASLSLENHYFYNRGVNGPTDGLDDSDRYRFGGVEGSVKYSVLSPFKDPVGLAFRIEGGYLSNDEVDGLPQHDRYVAPEMDLQRNFFDDTLICEFWYGSEFAWGKQPAEQYPRELAIQGGAGISYRVAPNWFIGIESHVRSEWPMFDFDNFEHVVVYGGPSLHYTTKRWWTTLTWVNQVWGEGIDEPHNGQTFAEETRQAVRLKLGVNF